MGTVTPKVWVSEPTLSAGFFPTSSPLKVWPSSTDKILLMRSDSLIWKSDLPSHLTGRNGWNCGAGRTEKKKNNFLL